MVWVGVGIAQLMQWGATGWTIGIRFLAKERFLSSPQRPDRFWGSLKLLSKEYWCSFPEDKLPWACSGPLTQFSAEVRNGVACLHFTFCMSVKHWGCVWTRYWAAYLEKVAGKWRKVHIFYSSTNITTLTNQGEWGGECTQNTNKNPL
jgi:hypothetical protein